MNIEQWFPTTIGYTDNNLSDVLSAYRTHCAELTEDIPLGRPFINSQLQSTFNFKMPQHNINIVNDTRFRQLFDIVVEQGAMFAKVLGYNYELEVKNAWVNKIGPHDYHGFHSHVSSGDALIVGCFYVDAPVGAKVNFKSPYSEDYTPIDPSWDSPYNSKIVSYDCVPGRLMFFKSNILHGYDSHNSDKIKFSIPFDMSVKKL